MKLAFSYLGLSIIWLVVGAIAIIYGHDPSIHFSFAVIAYGVFKVLNGRR